MKPLARLCASAYTHFRMLCGGGGGGGSQGASIEGASLQELDACERSNSSPPSIPPQRERVNLVTALRSHFESEQRSFSMVAKSSNGRGAKFHCDGCSFEFRITKCTNSNSDLCGTWDVAKKSKESWKVCLPHALKGIDAFAQRVPTLVCLLA